MQGPLDHETRTGDRDDIWVCGAAGGQADLDPGGTGPAVWLVSTLWVLPEVSREVPAVSVDLEWLAGDVGFRARVPRTSVRVPAGPPVVGLPDQGGLPDPRNPPGQQAQPPD